MLQAVPHSTDKQTGNATVRNASLLLSREISSPRKYFSRKIVTISRTNISNIMGKYYD